MKKFGLELTSLIDESLEFIGNNLSNKGEIFVAFSGGKDSITVDKLMAMSKVQYKLFYSFTGIDPPELVKFIRKNYPKCIFIKPRRTFWRELSVSLPPGNIRWCCRLLKKEMSWKLPHRHRVFGIRKEESSARARYARISHFVNKQADYFWYLPIFHWKEWAIWDFIDKYNLPYPKLYDEGFGRIGCVICPFHSGKDGKLHSLYRKRWPKYFDLWEREIDKLYQKRVGQGKEMNYPTSKEFCDAWYKSSHAYWYKPKEDNEEFLF